MGNWSDNDFPNADDPASVEWMIVQWKIVPVEDCPTCERGDYGLRATQVDHLPRGTPRPVAIAKLEEYKQMHRTAGHNPDRKNHVVFLCRVEAMERISDIGGVISNG